MTAKYRFGLGGVLVGVKLPLMVFICFHGFSMHFISFHGFSMLFRRGPPLLDEALPQASSPLPLPGVLPPPLAGAAVATQQLAAQRLAAPAPVPSLRARLALSLSAA